MPIRSQLSPPAPAGPGALAFVSVGRSRMLSLANCSLMQSTLSTWDHSCVSGGAHLVRQFVSFAGPGALAFWTCGLLGIPGHLSSLFAVSSSLLHLVSPHLSFVSSPSFLLRSDME